jgi:hypothetical protein
MAKEIWQTPHPTNDSTGVLIANPTKDSSKKQLIIRASNERPLRKEDQQKIEEGAKEFGMDKEYIA